MSYGRPEIEAETADWEARKMTDMNRVAMRENTATSWRRSSLCNDAACVEVARLGHEVLVRDSKSPGPALVFTHEQWQAFLIGVKAGEFDVTSTAGGAA